MRYVDVKHVDVRLPTNVTRLEILRCPPKLDGDIVGVRFNLLSNDVVLSLLESMHDFEHISLVCVVTAFCRVELAAGACHQP